MKLFDDKYKYTPDAQKLDLDLALALKPVFRVTLEKGANPRELEYLTFIAAQTISLDYILSNGESLKEPDWRYPPKGYRLLQFGELLEPGDLAWTLINGSDCNDKDVECLVGWVGLDDLYPGQKIDEGHVPVVRLINPESATEIGS